jgi:hypothetical protein
MENLIVLMTIIMLIGGASYKLYKDKKKNIKCAGCPYYSSKSKCIKINNQ